MNTKKKIVRGGTLVSATGITAGDLLIVGEKIAAQAAPGILDAAAVDEVIDAQGMLVLPGLIDPHVHFNSPFMGTVTVHDYENGTQAAAFGGVTTIIDFSTQPKGGSLLANLEQKEEEARGRTYIDWSMHGILLDAGTQTLAEIPELIQEGVPTYKCFTTYKHAQRMVQDDDIVALLEVTARHGGMLMVHCENDSIIEYSIRQALAAGNYAPIYHARTRPPEAENIAIQRVVDLMRQVTAPVYIVHTSTAQSVEIIAKARMDGLPLHSETCTHYLALTEEYLLGPKGNFYICSPPLRKQADVDALWQAARAGFLEVVSTDDAGVPPEDNLRLSQGRFDKTPNGIASIETRLDILHSEGVCKGKITWPQLVALTSTNPARLFGLYPQKGHLAPGADADLVLYNPNSKWIMGAEVLHMNTSFCPFEGWEISGQVDSVLVRGQDVIRNRKLVGQPGFGRRVFRRLEA